MRMASRPAKRQRRSTIIQSDDNGSDTDRLEPREQSNTVRSNNRHNERANGSKLSTPQKRRLRNASVTSSPKSSPDKARKIPRKADAPNKSLHSFFGKATEEQRWKRDSATPDVDFQDQIEDDISDEDCGNEGSSKTSTTTLSFSSRLKQEIPSSSQKFVKSSTAARNTTPQTLEPGVLLEENQEQQPWADRYGPDNLEELAVHKKKVSDVQNWLQDVLAGRERKRLLILKGPAGSGKTSTISLLASKLGVKTIAWHNSTVSEAGMSSNVQQFIEFLNRGGGFGSLSFQDESSSESAVQESPPRLLLVEEFPIVVNRVSNTLDSFRNIMLQYLASSSQSGQLGRMSLTSYPPIVMLISETLLSSSTALSDSFTAHRLLGTEISNHPLTTIMEFNPVATTFVQKALDLVVKKEARDSKRRRTPGPAVLSKLAEIGDIRSAINSLEFLCARGDEESDWSGTVADRQKKKVTVPLTDMEKNALQLVSQRESTLDMFHAAGKIVYNKREDPRVLDTRAAPPPRPPDHLLYLYTPKKSQVDVDALLNETGTDIQTFVSTLHENYVLSCNGDDFVDSLDGCSHVLSDSDILNPESRNLIRGKGSANLGANFAQSGNSDMLRQDEISFQTASYGLLFHLPNPVSRAIPPGARKQDAFKMFYPGSLRLWKPMEEIYDLITMYANTDIDPQSLRPGASKDSLPNNGVSAWRSRGFGVHSIPDDLHRTVATDKDEEISKGVTSRDNYVLEILPYMTKIKTAQTKTTQSHGQSQSQSQDLQNLKKITQLRGINLTPTGEEPDENENENDIDNETDSATNRAGGASRSSSGMRMSFGQKIQAVHDSMRIAQQQQQQQTQTQHARMMPAIRSQMGPTPPVIAPESQNAAMEKLYISDDDISD